MKVSLWEIFLVFLKIGSLLFGGGGVIVLPLLEAEAVKKRGWISSEELIEFFAISQVIPGLNIPDVCMFVGYKLRGKSGAFVAGLGIIIVPFILIVSLAFVLSSISHFSIVKYTLWGIGIGTIVILSSAIRSIWSSSIVDKFTLWFFLFIFALTAFTNLSPVWIVFIALGFGVAKGFLPEKQEGSK